jgi:hypothetical protein
LLHNIKPTASIYGGVLLNAGAAAICCGAG